MDLQNSNVAGPADPAPSPEDDFYSGAAARLPWFMAAVGLVLTAAAWWKFGHSAALGFLAGSIIAFLNFHWLKSGVSALADRATNSGKAQSGAGSVLRFLLRYVLMGAAAYGILTSFPASLRGLLAGLFLPVGAIACEAAYETFAALTRRH
jgi:ATP synthase I chain